MQDQPNPAELINAVAEFLRSDVAPQLSGHAAFKLRVGLNALDLVVRQLGREEDSDAAETQRLSNLLGTSGSLEELNRELSARIARGVGGSVMRQDYIDAGRALGLSDRRIFMRYLTRNALASLLVYVSMRFGQVILIGSTLSFLGLGVRPPISELGMMAAQGRDFFLFAPHIAVIPSALIFIIVLAANVVGDALRDVLDPRMKS